MFDIAICDDERYQLGELEEMLCSLAKKMGIYLEIHVFEQGELLLEEIRRGTQFDIIYLDIELNGINGVKLAEELRKSDQTLHIIYVTQYENYIKKSINTMPSGYITKPINVNEFETVFRRVSGWIQGKDVYYRFISDKLPCKVLLKNILYFKSDLRRVEIVCEEQKYKIYKKLDQIEMEFTESCKNQFLRIHQSWLVNYNHINRFGYNWVELSSGEYLPISRKRRGKIEEILGKI